MPSLRVVNYYQHPCSPAFVHHMIEETGLSARDQEIAWRFRRETGNTAYYADLAGMPLKLFNEVSANINRREMDELFRLAQIGYAAEQKAKQ